MRRALLFVCAAVFTTALAAGPRLTFVRTLAAPHDLGHARRIALIYSLGDNDKVGTFVDVFVEQANRGPLHLDNAADQHLIGDRPDDATIRRVRKDHPADVYLGVKEFTCTLAEREGEGSTYNYDGQRVKQKQVWADARCTARVDILSPELQRRVSFQVKGEGTSPRVQSLTDEERAIALEQAARYAAVDAAEAVTPRDVRESIELDDAAPGFDEAWAAIDASRLRDAREIWEAELKKHRDSAALQYDLGAVAEAMGDVEAARRYYLEARRLSPRESRYKAELEMFLRRTKP